VITSDTEIEKYFISKGGVIDELKQSLTRFLVMFFRINMFRKEVFG